VDSWFELAEALYHGNVPRGRPIAEAREAFERVVALEPHHFAATVHLARLAAARRDTRGLDSLSRDALGRDPDGVHRAELLLLRAFGLDDGESRARFLAERHDLSTLDALWRAAEYSVALEPALAVVDQLLREPSSPEMRASLQLVAAHACMGL